MLINRFFSAPEKESFFLFGPRGTGKTTWLLHHFTENTLWIDFNDSEQVRFYSAGPERLREAVSAEPKKKTVVIDEVQRVPEILPMVHSLIESDKSRQFVLTGSSARKLKRTGVDLLAGRALLKTMHPFFAAELGSEFDIGDAMHYGMLPLLYGSKEKNSILRTYIALYIKEEVQPEGIVRNIGNFSRFIETMSFSHGSVLNMATIADESGIERKVVANYISILEDLLIGFILPVFSKRAKRAMTTHPKFFYFDAGVFRAIRPKGPFDKPTELDGLVLEGLIAQHLKAWVDMREGKEKLFFWRTRGGSEVDFVLYGEQGIFAFEVKNSTAVRKSDLRHLKTFLNDYPMGKGFFLYRGDRKLLIDDILCIPCREFLPLITPKTDFKRIDQSG